MESATRITTADPNIVRLSETVRGQLNRFPCVSEYMDRVVVGLHTMYPNGDSVCVDVTFAGGPDLFNVSDMAQGLQEAECSGVPDDYAKRAATLADEAGIEFDGCAIVAKQVKASQLPGAILWVAYCSAGALLLATRFPSQQESTG